MIQKCNIYCNCPMISHWFSSKDRFFVGLSRQMGVGWEMPRCGSKPICLTNRFDANLITTSFAETDEGKWQAKIATHCLVFFVHFHGHKYCEGISQMKVAAFCSTGHWSIPNLMGWNPKSRFLSDFQDSLKNRCFAYRAIGDWIGNAKVWKRNQLVSRVDWTRI